MILSHAVAPRIPRSVRSHHQGRQLPGTSPGILTVSGNRVFHEMTIALWAYHLEKLVLQGKAWHGGAEWTERWTGAFVRKGRRPEGSTRR